MIRPQRFETRKNLCPLPTKSIPSLVVHNHTRKPIRASNSNNVIENNNFDILYDMLVLKNVNASKSTVKNNKGNETKTRKKH